ncbi:MAG TPA: M3 family oligoendopeptidase [Anaerolineales bacterium]|nr:M3 family oligoendopeptidase [Anaerolineales bacterium]
MTLTAIAPRWDLSNVYPSLESEEFKAAVDDYKTQVAELQDYFDEVVAKAKAQTAPKELASIIGDIVDRFNSAQTLSDTIVPFIDSYVTTDSRDKLAMKTLSEFERASLPMDKLNIRFKAWLGEIASVLDEALTYNSSAQAHAFMLKEAAEQSRYLMSEAEEALASELNLSGGNAWSKLQGTVTSQLSVDFELDGETQKLPMPALINLRTHPEEETRHRAYDAENKAWDSVREVLAACMNGVKGEVITLNKRRGREDALHSALDQARIDRKTLEAMLAAMEASFPMFRRYYKHKAKLIGKEKLAWWDIYAPVGKADTRYTFKEASDFILDAFEKFSPELRSFSAQAFDNNWIDAEMREGKRGGGFCMQVQGVKESRILVNFDGSQDQISTIAHELGHAFHNECAYQFDKTVLQQITPMTLAETASTFCETTVTEAVLSQVKDPQEELAVLEGQLNNASQVIVDIYSRYLFEKEVFERREQAELSVDDFCEIMERAQKAAYGDGLDERYLQKYMWTWKPHYYSTGVSFYNFPYSFGLLFGTGLYAIYKQRGSEFVEDYKALLASTGEASAADLAARFGIDIRTRKFWEDSLAIIGSRVDRYCEL